MWGGGADVYDPATFLAQVAACVRVSGWTSRTVARDRGVQSTADLALYLLGPAPVMGRDAWRKAREAHAVTADDTTRGAGALAWARGLTGASDYERNLTLVASQETIERAHAGILASAVAAYARHLGDLAKREAAAKRAPSAHVGTAGEKIDTTATIERVFSFDSMYGTTFVHKMLDAAGNVLVWKTGRSHGAAGDAVTVRGTIKAHGEYKGEKQTELTRCKIGPVADAATPAPAPRAKRTRKVTTADAAA